MAKEKCSAGTSLAQILGFFGFQERPDCPCKSLRKKMDNWGCEECAKRKREIVDSLRKEAAFRGIPFLYPAAAAIVSFAIWRAKNAQRPPLQNQ